MKLVICQSLFGSHCTPIISIKPDTALLRNNNAFFIPDFSSVIEYQLFLVIKLSKMGKCISKNFAHRYYQEVGIAVNFTAKDVFETCIRQKQATDMAYSFDNSSAISPAFIKKEELSSHFSFSLLKNQEKVQEASISEMNFSIDEAIAHISKYVTLKIGDYVLLGSPNKTDLIKKEDRFQGFINDRLLLDFNIQ